MQAVLPWIVAGVSGFAAIFFFILWNGSKQTRSLPSAQNGDAAKSNATKNNELEKKLEALRGELAAAREDTQRKQKQLDEVREEAKKKLRRDGKKAEREDEQKASGPDPRDVEIQGLRKGLSSLESQLNVAKKETERATAELERLQGSSRSEADGARKARDDERNRNQSLVDENAALKKTLEELRAARKKESERPDVPGTAIDLKSLPVDAVQELARYFRKGEEFERLYNVSQGQIQLAQDRYMELQRRYFAVCRELALVAGAKPSSDDEAKSLAEGLVAGTERMAGPPGGALSTDAEAGKKRRRRRRKRKPGAPGDVVTAADEPADSDDEGDDADLADDSSDEDDGIPQAVLAGGTDSSGSSAPASA